MSTFTTVLTLIVMGLVVLVLIRGLFNMMKGGSGNTSGKSSATGSDRADGGSTRRNHAAGGEARSDRRSGAELRAAGNEAVGDAGAEDAEPKQRQRGEHDRHGVVDRWGIAAKTRGEL